MVLTDSSLIAPGTISAWNWSFGDSTSSSLQNPTHTYADTGLYVVTLSVSSDSGCVASYTDTLVFVPCANGEINPPAVPTAFTPNNDGHNDILYVMGGPFKELHFRIYNEWGNEIFSSDSQSVGWDGTYKGQVVQEGVYVVKLRYMSNCTAGMEYEAIRHVTVLPRKR